MDSLVVNILLKQIIRTSLHGNLSERRTESDLCTRTCLFCRTPDFCLLTSSSQSVDDLSAALAKKPGQRFGPHEQCQLIFGQTSYYCGVSEFRLKPDCCFGWKGPGP